MSVKRESRGFTPALSMAQSHCLEKEWIAARKRGGEELLSPFLHVILDELGSVFLQNFIDLID